MEKSLNSKMNFAYFKEELQKLLVFLPVERPDWEQHLNDLYTEYKSIWYPKYSIEEFAIEWFDGWDTKTHHCMLKSKAIAQRDERVKQGIKPTF